ncbi:MAG: fold metallo-hydrolase [Acidimicrobiia bacterium]|nr:fold metallo-hydrolase [Acidimicrobiia bacterium]
MLTVRVPAWLAETNAYILAEESGGQAIVVDAPPDPDAIGAVLIQHDLTLSAVILTHGHIDHTGGSGELARATGASVYVHPDDDFLTLHPLEQLRAMFGMTPPGVYDVPEKFEAMSDGDRIRLAGLEFEVRHTPGHTPGHCCFYLEQEETLFSGDQLFAGSIGRTDLPGGSLAALMTSMDQKVMVLPDHTRVLPGHGPETTIGRERTGNPFLQ